jgi:hypothetical protein
VIEPEVPTAVVADDRSALDVGATAVAVPVCRDAIAYATATLAPSVIVDIATLTGAATLGLGRRHAALYTPSDPLAAALTAAGVAAGERLWRMPLVDDHRESLESAVADVAHVETRKMGGGSITAALFLQRFAGEVPWAHLDIAGPGRRRRARGRQGWHGVGNPCIALLARDRPAGRSGHPVAQSGNRRISTTVRPRSSKRASSPRRCAKSRTGPYIAVPPAGADVHVNSGKAARTVSDGSPAMRNS